MAAMLKHQFEARGGLPARAQKIFRLAKQQTGGMQHLRAVIGLAHQFEARGKALLQQQRLARVGTLTEDALDILNDRLAKTARNAIARQARQITKLRNAERQQGIGHFLRPAGEIERNAGQRNRQGWQLTHVRCRHPAGARMREQPRRARRRRARRNRTHASARQFALDALRQRFQAAKQHQAGRHFEQHRIDRQGDHRREMHRRQGRAVQQRVLARHFTPPCRQVRRQCARCAQRHAGVNAAGARDRIGRQNQRPLLGAVNHRERQIDQQAAPRSLQRQFGQIERDPQRRGAFTQRPNLRLRRRNTTHDSALRQRITALNQRHLDWKIRYR